MTVFKPKRIKPRQWGFGEWKLILVIYSNLILYRPNSICQLPRSPITKFVHGLLVHHAYSGWFPGWHWFQGVFWGDIDFWVFSGVTLISGCFPGWDSETLLVCSHYKRYIFKKCEFFAHEYIGIIGYGSHRERFEHSASVYKTHWGEQVALIKLLLACFLC